MGQVVPTNEGQSLDLVQAGAVALIGLTGTLLGHHLLGISARARGTRGKIPLCSAWFC